jgi:hypothetical protein
MRHVVIGGACLLALLVAVPSHAQDMELSNPEMSDFGDEGQAEDFGNDTADRAVIDDDSQEADLEAY